MLRGQYKCIVMVQYKGKEDDVYIAPNCFEKTFEDLGILSGGQITLVELRNYKSENGSDVEGDEGGEEEHEEMEDELEEEEGEADQTDEKQHAGSKATSPKKASPMKSQP